EGVVDETGSFEAEISLPNGVHVLSVRAVRDSGTLATSPDVLVTVQYTDATLAFASPQPDALLALDDDASIDTGFQIRFELASTKLSGGTGEIACNGLRAPFDLSADGTASAFLTVPDAPCGGLPLRCTARVETEA